MIKSFLQDYQIQFSENESLKKHITFKVGGEAKFVVMPTTIEQVMELIIFLKQNNIRYYVIGRGSNVIFRDEGFDGVVIKTSGLQQIEFLPDNKVYAGAGVVLNVLCKALQEKSLAGLEFCYGIPGNVGGGLYMNCGAYGGEICTAVYEVEYIMNTAS